MFHILLENLLELVSSENCFSERIICESKTGYPMNSKLSFSLRHIKVSRKLVTQWIPSSHSPCGTSRWVENWLPNEFQALILPAAHQGESKTGYPMNSKLSFSLRHIKVSRKLVTQWIPSSHSPCGTSRWVENWLPNEFQALMRHIKVSRKLVTQWTPSSHSPCGTSRWVENWLPNEFQALILPAAHQGIWMNECMNEWINE